MEIASESFATMHTFLEGRIPEQKMTIARASEENRLFPKVLLPAQQCATSHDRKGGIADVTHNIHNNRDWIQHQLKDHGALLFKGFPLRSAADFSSFVKAFGWEEQRYERTSQNIIQPLIISKKYIKDMLFDRCTKICYLKYKSSMPCFPNLLFGTK